MCVPGISWSRSPQSVGGETLNPPDEPNHPCAQRTSSKAAGGVAPLHFSAGQNDPVYCGLFDLCGVDKTINWQARSWKFDITPAKQRREVARRVHFSQSACDNEQYCCPP